MLARLLAKLPSAKGYSATLATAKPWRAASRDRWSIARPLVRAEN